ncbi:TetR family transcriptional regulator [Sinomonas cellulolyticus]|nr:TetR family transcriptional regulator [Sinomonas sp. KCTC 49339]
MAPMSRTVKKRPYASPTREAKAAATRARILDAAADLFLRDGYHRSSTAAIARAAHTSEASVFAAFGSKAELLVAVVTSRVVQHPDFPLGQSPTWKAFAGRPDAEPAVQEFARVVRRAHERSWRLLAVAAAAGHDDPTVASAVAGGAMRRHADCAWLVREAFGVPASEALEATDAVWTLISVENYRHLVVERGWAPQRYESWLAAMLRAALPNA